MGQRLRLMRSWRGPPRLGYLVCRKLSLADGSRRVRFRPPAAFTGRRVRRVHRLRLGGSRHRRGVRPYLVGWNNELTVERISELAGTIDSIASAIEAALEVEAPSDAPNAANTQP